MGEKRKRILFVGTLPPPVHGSAVVSQQIKESAKINRSFRCDWVNLSTSRSTNELGKFNMSKPFRLIGALIRELWLLTTRKYDLCYLAITCHGIGFLKDTPFVLLCKLFRRRVIIHQHNKGMLKDVDKWPYRWLLPLCYKNAKVILLSWHLYPDIEKVVPRENVMVCPNGIKVAQKTLIQQKEETNTNLTDITNKVPKLLFLSNLIESKGVIVLLDALKILADKCYSFCCDFVGGETKEINAKRFADEVDQRGLSHFVVYCGRRYGKEKEEALKNSDVFVLPTFYDNECFPLVLLEAMSYGLPIVTTNEGGILDIVNDGINGLICEKNNPESLADSIEKLIKSHEVRIKMGLAGKSLLYENFTDVRFEECMHECLLNA